MLCFGTPTGRHGRQGASGEVFPLGAVVSLGGVHHAALPGAVWLDPGRHDPHKPSVPLGEPQTL